MRNGKEEILSLKIYAHLQIKKWSAYCSHPCGMQIGDDLNVLMMAAELLDNSLAVKLMFMDPDQFQDKKGSEFSFSK